MDEAKKDMPRRVYFDQMLDSAVGQRVVAVTQHGLIISGILTEYGRFRLHLKDAKIQGKKTTNVPWTILQRDAVSHVHPEAPVESLAPLNPQTAEEQAAQAFERKCERLVYQLNGKLRHVHYDKGNAVVHHPNLPEIESDDPYVLPEVIRRFESEGWQIVRQDAQFLAFIRK